MVEDDEAALVRRLREGDEAAFAALVARYQGRMLRLAETMVPSRSVAEEVVQDTWLGVVKGIGGFEGRASVKTWVFRILVNRARSAGSREPRTVSLDLVGEPVMPASRFDASGAWASPPARWADEVDDRLVAKQLAEKIRAVLPDLPGPQREVLVLRDLEGVSSEETCELLGLTAGNQRVLLHRARARVRAVLEAELVEDVA